jgi:hypothetical protein
LAFLFWGVLYVCENRKRKWIVYVVLSIIAYGFHTSTIIPSLLFASVYFFQLKTRKIALTIVIVSGLFGVVLNSFDSMSFFKFFINMSLTTDKLNSYMTPDHQLVLSAGYIHLLRYTWLGVFVYYFIDESYLNHWFSKIFLIAICIYNLFVGLDMMLRINLPFFLFSVVVIPWAIFGKRFSRFRKKEKWIVLVPVLIVAYFTQAYMRTHIDYDIEDAGRLHPYYFFWEDYHTHPSITVYWLY